MASDLRLYRPPRRTAGSLVCATLLVLIATGYGLANAQLVKQSRTRPADLDGWGHLIGPIQASGHRFAALFSEPSLWKGPVVPFVFGLSYYLIPCGDTVLVFNVAAFALAAGCLFTAFTALGAGRYTAALAVLLWVFYLPHRYVFGYYYAEPFLSLLVAGVFLLAGRLITRPAWPAAFACGALAGLLLLSRAPYLLVVLALPVWLWFHLGAKRVGYVALFVLGLVLTFSPWTVRNYLVHGEFIPFTLEGGKILFQGSYLAGDDSIMDNLRQIPEYNEIEKTEVGKSAVEQYRYWQALALEQIRRDPAGQLRLCLRKALRFWVYLPDHSWVPSWRTGVVAALCLPLALLGVVGQWRSPLVQLCAVWAGGLWLFHTLVHAELRYNFPVLPMMFLAAVVGAQTVWAGRARGEAQVSQAETTRRSLAASLGRARAPRSPEARG
jgi:hypothetical protein